MSKRGKNPTAAQKRWMSSLGYSPREWLVVSWTMAEAVFKHRTTGEVKTVQILE